MRLDQFLSARTMYTRRQLRQMIQNGAVTVDDIVVRQAGQTIQPQRQRICLEGKHVPGDAYLYILLNKPRGYVCSAHEPGQHIVFELIPPELMRKDLQPVGRLDKDSTGMLLLTDDGQLSHQITAARSHAEKYYVIELARPWESFYAQRFADGITLADGAHCIPAKAACIPGTENKVLVQLHEGKYHQVRRMMAALGNHVQSLQRIAIGGLILPPDLPCGACRRLGDEDIQKILKSRSDFATMLQILKKSSS